MLLALVLYFPVYPRHDTLQSVDNEELATTLNTQLDRDKCLWRCVFSKRSFLKDSFTPSESLEK